MVEHDSSQDSVKPRGIRIRALHQFQLSNLKFNIIDEAISVNTITTITAALINIVAIYIMTAIIIDANAISTVATAVITATAIIVVVIVIVATTMAAGGRPICILHWP